jgi:acyl transferase domain-containing protein/acyl carrier protein
MTATSAADRGSGVEIAVVGMGCRFPGAENADRFWDNLCGGVESVTFFSEEELRSAGVPRDVLDDPRYVKAQGVLEGSELFDEALFGISPREAGIMDPQHRLLLECAWEALEDGGYDPRRVSVTTGMFAGGYRNDYLLQVPCSDDPAAAFLRNVANECDYLATRISYTLNLTGPSVSVQTACSTSLVAVHLACQSLITGACDMALAGGVTVRAGQRPGYFFREGGILSSDGHCRAFDADGEGTVISEGVGLVLLKRLTDALRDRDNVRVIIKGSAVGNDGAGRVGFTAPGVEGQARLIQAAHAAAHVSPRDITYVEAHGSGTPLGDRIEVAALARAFRDVGEDGSCAIGSVKTNIGHAHAAAGIAGLVKTALALEHRMIPASLHFARPNPQIDFEGLPFYVNTALTEWKDDGGPRRAGVSSFGIGGTGAHVVLEEPPALQRPIPASRAWQVFTLTAGSEQGLETVTDRLVERLEGDRDLDPADVAYTLHLGRAGGAHRRAVVARDAGQAAEALRVREGPSVLSSVYGGVLPRIAFMFPGLGDQYGDMGRELYASERVFREEVNRCCELVKVLSGMDILGVLYPRTGEHGARSGFGGDPDAGGVDLRRMLGRRREETASSDSPLDATEHAQPAIFVVEYALARLWMSWGMRPDAMIGYSIGEYVAACLAGVLTLEEALLLVTSRARMIAGVPKGSMLAVPLPEDRLREMLDPMASVAAVNGPSLCVVAGPEEKIAGLENRLQSDSVPTRRLRVSHAFHSRMMEPIAAKLLEFCRTLRPNAPKIPFVSNVTGTWITAAQAADPAYWVHHMCEAVRFADGVVELWRAPGRILIEVGPGQTLGSLALAARPPEVGVPSLVLASLPSTYERQSDARFILNNLAKLWLAGVPVDWESFHADERRRRVRLPTYPFDRRPHWAGPRGGHVETTTPPRTGRLEVADWFHVPVWGPLPPLTRGQQGRPARPEHWLLFVDECGVGGRLEQQLQERGHIVTTVAMGEELRELGPGRYAIDPGRIEDYSALLEGCRRGSGLPQRVVHSWSVTPDATPRGLAGLKEIQRRGLYSLLNLAQALGKENLNEPVEVSIVSNDMHALSDGDRSRPEKATLLGPCMVMPQENPWITCRSIDISLPSPGSWQERRCHDLLVAELAEPVGEKVLAHRGPNRWRRTFLPLRLDGNGAGSRSVRERGVYLITGGLGGIGLVLSQHLARTARARLVLTGRSALPPRDDWDRWVEAHGRDDATADKIRQVRELEAAGAEVLVLRADAASFSQMQDVVEEACRRFGGVDGVIHAAGVSGGGLIQLKDRGEVERVLAPKVEGALVLEALCRPLQPDFLLFCSSLLGVAGELGQVDYCAANAFLDAFAHHVVRTGGPYTVSVDWDAWRQVGMAFRAIGKGSRPVAAVEQLDHPLVHSRLIAAPRRSVYAATFNSAESWLVDEHRMLGNPVVPGTGHLEMVRAAFEHQEGAGYVEMRDVTFFTPIVLREGETKEVRILLEGTGDAGDGLRFSVVSSYGGQNGGRARWQLHSTGRVGRPGSLHRRQRWDVAAIVQRCSLREIGRTPHASPMGLGRRSRTLQTMYVGDNEFLALIELPPEFGPELEKLKLHPSVMDIAAAFVGLHAATEFRIPISYGRIQMRAPLTRRVYSYQRYRDADRPGRETVSADITIMDEYGRELVCIEEFLLKRAGDLEGRLTTVREGTSSEIEPYDYTDEDHHAAPSNPALLREHLERGILAGEGVEVFDRILSAGVHPQALVSTADLGATIDRSNAVAPGLALDGAAPGTIGSQPRPNLHSPFVDPESDVEQRLSALWQELLGVERVGIHDHFFELGGHSLLGLQLLPRLREAFGIDIPLGCLFEAMTVSKLADVVTKIRENEDDRLVVGSE